MMNYFRLPVFLILFPIIIACSDEDNSSTKDHNSSEMPIEIPESTSELDEEKIDLLRDSVEKAQTAVSPFLSEGCCKDEARKLETCCCDAVYDKYKSMLDQKQSDMVEIRMTDPILAGCKKLMPKEFDQLENPPSEEPDELDALFE